jgi:YD repeat-containing protein
MGTGGPPSVVRPNRKVDGSAAPGASSYTTLFEHDVRGFVTKVRSEVTSGTFAESTFTYSPLGYVQTATDPNGKVTRTDYDERGFLWKVRHAYGTSDEISETQDYDLDGQPIAARQTPVVTRQRRPLMNTVASVPSGERTSRVLGHDAQREGRRHLIDIVGFDGDLDDGR